MDHYVARVDALQLTASRPSGEQSRQREGTNAQPGSQLRTRSSPPDMSNSLPTQERKPHIQADIFGNCSGMASLIPSKPPSLPFSPDLLAYSHPQVPNTGYLDWLWNPLCPSLSWHISWCSCQHLGMQGCGSFALLGCFFFPPFFFSPLPSPSFFSPLLFFFCCCFWLSPPLPS